MTRDEPAPGDWIGRLHDALAGLVAAQAAHRDEIDRRFTESKCAREELPGMAVRRPSDALRMFYSTVYREKPRPVGQRYGSLRSALKEVWEVIREHPALADVRTAPDEQEEFLVRLPGQVDGIYPMSLVSGLIARGQELPRDGSMKACREFAALLDPDKEAGTPREFGYLATGYHVTLFHGLRFEEKAALTDDVSIMPFGQVEEFVDYRVLQSLGPDIERSIAANGVSAIVKRFTWAPGFHSTGGVWMLDTDWGGPFREDAEAFIELLAVGNGSPVVCLATFHYCIHRAASCLLGQPDYQGGYIWGRSMRSLDRLATSREPDMAILDEAGKLFGERNDDRYSDCAPAIARLAEALARSGRFTVDDQILDVAIALERIHKPDGRGISAQLQESVAGLLANGSEEQTRMKEAIKHFYDVRSAIIHGPKDEKKRRLLQERSEAFQAGFDLARRSILKLLSEGPLSDRTEP